VKLAIGIVVSRGFPVSIEFWDSYEHLTQHIANGQTNEELPDHLKVEAVRRIKSTQFPVDAARNEICREVLASDEQWLLFLDCDHTFSPDLAARLLRHDTPVVSARYHMRRPPYHAVAYVKHRILEGPHRYAPVHFGKGLIEIERGGAGALLIHRRVLEKIRFEKGENWFRYQKAPDPPHDMTVSEDFWFYRAAREAGFKCYLDWETEAKHLQTIALGREQNLAFLDAQVKGMAQMSTEERQKVVDGLVVLGHNGGLRLDSGELVPEYQITPGER